MKRTPPDGAFNVVNGAEEGCECVLSIFLDLHNVSLEMAAIVTPATVFGMSISGTGRK
jgi:hypothetical protein